jgi:hypothetical protein
MVTPLDDALRLGESHTVEFKKSLGLHAEIARTVVAFANAHGGDVFCGVRPDGTVVGVDVGANTLERLAADLDRHIYPYAPVAIDPLETDEGKTVVRVSVVPDTPPVVGVYLYSSDSLKSDARVSMAQLDAYRRVGRTNRRAQDPMWLRPRLPGDPFLVVDCNGGTRGAVIPRTVGVTVLMAENSGLAHALRFRMDPELFQPFDHVRNLPMMDGRRSVSFSRDLDQRDEPPDGASLIVEYQDDWGCLWESRRCVAFRDGDARPTARQERRIVELPPKQGTA